MYESRDRECALKKVEQLLNMVIGKQWVGSQGAFYRPLDLSLAVHVSCTAERHFGLCYEQLGPASVFRMAYGVQVVANLVCGIRFALIILTSWSHSAA